MPISRVKWGIGNCTARNLLATHIYRYLDAFRLIKPTVNGEIGQLQEPAPTLMLVNYS